jgi:two-component system, NtrC family, sensor histidine kinase PilS
MSSTAPWNTVKPPNDSALEPVTTHAAFTWRPLKVLVLYRLLIAGFLAAFAITAPPVEFLKTDKPLLFFVAAMAYLIFATATAALSNTRRPQFRTQVYVQAIGDILAIEAFMYADAHTGGMLGILLVVAVTGASMLISRKGAIVLASAATVPLLILSGFIYWETPPTEAAAVSIFVQSGLLGMVLFLAALTANSLANTARENAQLAIERGVALADLEQLNEYVVQHLQAGIIAVDHEGHIRLLNESARIQLGLSRHETLLQLNEASTELARQFNEWRVNPRFAPNIFAPTLEAPTVMPRFTPFGSHAGGTVIILDDTAILSSKIQQVKLASLGRLTASIAHEIRNPLGAISHAAQLLRESEALTGTDQRLIQIITDQSRRMNTIIENILQLSRREESRPRSLILIDWLSEFASDFCRDHGLDDATLQVNVTPVDTHIWFDTNHLQQVLWNLCQNALKYGRSATSSHAIVELRGGIDSALSSPYLEVRDRGAGVPPDIAAHIFEPFVTSDTKGTGLGLYICRELCECNQARLQYIAPAEGGACFRIHFVDTNRQVL